MSSLDCLEPRDVALCITGVGVLKARLCTPWFLWLILGIKDTVVFLILVFCTSFSLLFGILKGSLRVFWYSTTPWLTLPASWITSLCNFFLAWGYLWKLTVFFPTSLTPLFTSLVYALLYPEWGTVVELYQDWDSSILVRATWPRINQCLDEWKSSNIATSNIPAAGKGFIY